MDNIETYIRNCVSCQSNKASKKLVKASMHFRISKQTILETKPLVQDYATGYNLSVGLRKRLQP